MKQYVVGFLFSENSRDVVLIRKNRPEWQAGKFNGVGGKIEPTDESPVAAMSREFFEETGINILRSEWDNFLIMRGDADEAITGSKYPFQIYFFRAFSSDIRNAETVTDEQIYVLPADDFPKNVVPNLKYLLPMAVNKNMLYGEITVQ